MSERISPWAFVPAAAVLVGAALFFSEPWSGPAEAEWAEVNDSVAQLLAVDKGANEEVQPIVTAAVEVKEPVQKTEVPRSTQPEDGSLININTASAAELDSLQGIGPSKAAAIIAYREQHGPFDSTEAVMNVKGIGEKMFAKMKDRITTGSPSADKK